MASSGSASVNVTNYDTLQLNWTVNSQSTANNTSNITFTAKLVAGSSGKISSSASKSYTAVINGTTYTGTNTVGVSSGATKTLFSKTLNIAHNSDGSCSFTFKFTQEFAITFSGSWIGSKTASCTVSPNTIARASSLTSAAAVTLGDKVSVVWTPASSSFAFKLKFALGSKTYTTGYITPNKTSAYTYTGYTMSISDWAAQITNSTTGTCTVTLYTYSSSSSSSSIGSSSKTFTVTVPTSVAPSVSIDSTSEGSSDVTLGVYVKGKSKVKVKFTGTSAYSAALSTYTLVVDSTKYTGSCSSGTAKTVTSGILSTAGTISIELTITDARGRSATVTTTITVYDYSNPKASTFTATRCTKDGTEDPTGGEYAKVVYSYSCSSCNNKNTGSMTIKWKEESESSYSNQIASETGLSGSGTIFLDDIFSVEDGYTFQITITDAFTTFTRSTILSTAQYPISIYKSGKGVAFGKVADTEDLMDVNYAARILNNLEIIQEKSNIGGYLVNVQNNAKDSDTYIRVTGFSGKRIHIGIGSGGNNRGIYDPEANHWMIYTDADNVLHLAYPDGTYVPYYKAGDSFDAYWSGAGYITSSGTSLRFTVPLRYPILGSPDIAVGGTLILRQNGGYVCGSSADAGVSPSSWEDVVYGATGLRITATMGSTSGVTNNDAVGIVADLTITLS